MPVVYLPGCNLTLSSIVPFVLSLKQARREKDTISGSPVSKLPVLITINQPTHVVINLLLQRGMC